MARTWPSNVAFNLERRLMTWQSYADAILMHPTHWAPRLNQYFYKWQMERRFALLHRLKGGKR